MMGRYAEKKPLPVIFSHDTMKKMKARGDGVDNQLNQGGFSPVNEEELEPRKKHSGLGIASFSLFGGMAILFVLFLVMFIMRIAGEIDFTAEAVDAEELAARIEQIPELAIYPLVMLATLAGNLIGLILGIIGLIQKERKKVFAILGTVFNGLVLGFLGVIMLIGILSVFAAV